MYWQRRKIGKEIELCYQSLFNSLPMSPNNRTIAILGMHRSGTSALMGSLEQAGVYIGETNQHANDNIRGNRESLEILTLHNDLLERRGGSWDKPIRNMQWDPIHRALQTTIIKTFEDQPIWGFKDPRTLLTTNMWLKAIPTLELVGIFRHPFLVANSLMTRNNMSADQALDLWYCYNINLQWIARNGNQFPILEFSTDPADFKTQLQQLILMLDLDSRQTDFFDATLRKQTIPDLHQQPMAQRCLTLYESLKSLGRNSLPAIQSKIA